jgi:ABC-2 type transport system permease protein
MFQLLLGKSIPFGARIPFAFFVLKLTSTMNDKLDCFKYFSLIRLFDSKAIVANEGYVTKIVVLCATGIILDITGMRIRCVINPSYCMMVSPIP